MSETTNTIEDRISASAKRLILFPAINQTAFVAITSVIQFDEGGWKLETDPSDHDGGWTYGGMTWNTFKDYFPTATLEDIRNCIVDNNLTAKLRQSVVRIYYQEFYTPLLSGPMAAEGVLPEAYHLSCAINCGTETAKRLFAVANGTTGRGTDGKRLTFIKVWMDHYFSILAADPSKSKYIHGWINRAWKYV